MKTLLNTILTFGLIALNFTAYACQVSIGGKQWTQTINLNFPENIVVDAGANRDIVWRSASINARLRCEKPQHGSYYVYLNLNPQRLSITGFDILVNMYAHDYRLVDGQKTGVPILEVSTGGDDPTYQYTDLNLGFSIARKGMVSLGMEQVSLPAGPIATISQLQSSGGPRLTIVGSGKVRVLSCQSALEIQPSEIDFGNISARMARSGKEARSESFSISDIRRCDKVTPYGISAIFSPEADARVDAGTKGLVPVNNDSVEIRLRDSTTGAQMPFGQKIILFPTTTTVTSISKSIDAALFWRTDQPKLGAFRAATTVVFSYE